MFLLNVSFYCYMFLTYLMYWAVLRSESRSGLFFPTFFTKIAQIIIIEHLGCKKH